MSRIRPSGWGRHAAWAAGLLGLAAGGCIAPVQESTPVPGRLAPGMHDPWTPLDAPWTGWDDETPALCDFQRAREWSVLTSGETRVDMAAAPDPFGADPAGAAAITALTPGPIASVLLAPRNPVLLPEGAQRIEVVLGMEAPADAPALEAPRLILNLADAAGRTWRVDMGAFPRGHWELRNRLLPAEAQAPERRLRLAYFEVANWQAPQTARLWVKPPRAYLESPAAIIPDWQPESHRKFQTPVAFILRGRGGTNEGTALLPPPVTEAPRLDVREEGNRLILTFSRAAEDERSLVFVTEEWWKGADLLWKGNLVGRWEGVGGVATRSPLVVRSVGPDRVVLRHADGLGVEWHGHEGRLAMDVTGGAIRIPALSAGPLRLTQRTAGEVRLALCSTTNRPGARVQMWTRPGDTPLFTSVTLDPWISQSARLEPAAAEREGEGGGRAVYAPDTRGRRPMLHERIWIGFAREVEQVLPVRPLGRAPRADAAAGAVWVEGGATNRLWAVCASASGLATLLPCPARAEGSPCPPLFLCGDDLHPDHQGWSRRILRHAPGGEWIDGPAAGSYRVRIPFLALWQKHLAHEGAGRPPASVYAGLMDEPLWSYTDYDARVPGAAGLAAAREALCELVAQEGWPAEERAVVVAGAGWAGHYAGLADAIELDFGSGPATGVDGAGAGMLAQVFQFRRGSALMGPRQPSITASPADRDLWVAGMLACGAAPRLDATGGRDADSLRALLLAGPWHARTALLRLERLGYEQDGVIVGLARALETGAWQRNRQYHRYEGGYEIWINLGNAPWNVQVGAVLYRLPPGGWVASGPGITAGVMLEGAARVRFVASAEYRYAEGGTRHAALSSVRPVGVRQLGDRAARILFPEGGAAAEIDFATHFWTAGAELRGTAHDAAGQVIGPVAVRVGDRSWSVSVPPAAAYADVTEVSETD